MTAAEVGRLDSFGRQHMELANNEATLARTLASESAQGFRHPHIFPRPSLTLAVRKVSHEPSLRPSTDLYASAFTPTSGHCWRMVHDPDPGRSGIPSAVRNRKQWGVYRTKRASGTGQTAARTQAGGALGGHPSEQMPWRKCVTFGRPGSHGVGLLMRPLINTCRERLVAYWNGNRCPSCHSAHTNQFGQGQCPAGLRRQNAGAVVLAAATSSTGAASAETRPNRACSRAAGRHFWGIAAGVVWEELALYNGIFPPGLIYVGQVIEIPPASYWAEAEQILPYGGRTLAPIHFLPYHDLRPKGFSHRVSLCHGRCRLWRQPVLPGSSRVTTWCQVLEMPTHPTGGRLRVPSGAVPLCAAPRSSATGRS